MKITEIRISFPKTEIPKIKAFVGITIEDSFAVHGIKIIEGEKGLFVAMPTSKTTDGYRDVCHPINKETREMISNAILEAYEKESKESK